jgi:Fe-S cluster biosynthesis and repair protein YggX
MARMVNCIVLGKQAEGLERSPYPGDLGDKILANVSQEGWQRWMQHQTILINENQLALFKPEARKFLEKEMEKFFFEGGSVMPEGFVAPTK